VLGGSLILDQTPHADGQTRRLKFERTAHNSDLEKIKKFKELTRKKQNQQFFAGFDILELTIGSSSS
jgi:hypothetical protein